MPRCGERLTERVTTSGALGVSRYLGLSLGGAKSDRTCLSVIDYYSDPDKAFVVDIFESIGPEGDLTSDQVLIELVEELSHDSSGARSDAVRALGADAPLTLPPCLQGCEEDCKGYDKCKRPEIRWMRQQFQRAKLKNKKLKHFTPYSQRPVDLYFRYKHEDENLFQDETMGANLAPQTVRMNYLKRYFGDLQLFEVWPKLTLFYLQKALRLSRREVLEYRNIERGQHIRAKILEKLAEKAKIFIYERDLKKLVGNINAFDSLLCAWVAMQSDLDRVVKFKTDLPLDSGWVQIPEL
jgi:hypothetical protein